MDAEGFALPDGAGLSRNQTRVRPQPATSCAALLPGSNTATLARQDSSSKSSTWCLSSIRTPLAHPSGPPAKLADC